MKLRTLITMMTTGTMLAASASAWADVSNRDNRAYTIDIVTSTGSHSKKTINARGSIGGVCSPSDPCTFNLLDARGRVLSSIKATGNDYVKIDGGKFSK
jgi:hypothetical protein